MKINLPKYYRLTNPATNSCMACYLCIPGHEKGPDCAAFREFRDRPQTLVDKRNGKEKVFVYHSYVLESEMARLQKFFRFCENKGIEVRLFPDTRIEDWEGRSRIEFRSALHPRFYIGRKPVVIASCDEKVGKNELCDTGRVSSDGE